ncbi:MAG TPA: dioxygenase [Vicinamibacterales bacterium]|nr:dioxygenase [Vicinamibacterales bacterium]
MIISNDQELTEQVLAVMRRTSDPRLREIMEALVRHLHGFVREVRLTEDEFRAGTALIARLGQLTTPTHNEVVLMAGSLGIAPLVVLLNNGRSGTGNSASMLGPFWRKHAPRTENGGSLLRSDTPGPRFVFTGHVVDRRGEPVAGADVDVWHSSTVGLYENQDPSQADMNLRGIFTTDDTGRFQFTSIKPAGYPIPHEDNVVGELLRAQGRHCFRPAHVHLMVVKPGYKTLISQIYMPDDPHIDDDVQFGVRRELIADLVRHDEPSPAHPEWPTPWYSVEHTLYLDSGASTLPLAPID